MATLTATPEPAYGRVLLELSGFATATAVDVTRTGPSGMVVTVARGKDFLLTSGAGVLYDYETPLDLPYHYDAVQSQPVGGTEGASSEDVVLVTGDLSWLKDPGYPSYNMAIPVVTNIPQLTRPSRAGVFNILDRRNPVVVTAIRQGAVGTLECHTLNDAQRRSMVDILARGTVLLLQTPSAYGFGSQYVVVDDVVEARVGLAMEPARRWTLPFRVVDRPTDYDKAVLGRTWRDVKTAYATWGDLKASGKTWRQLAEAGL